MVMDAYLEENPEMRDAYRTDGQLLIHRRMHFHLRVSATTVQVLLFADDCVLSATTEEDTQRSMYHFAAVSANFDQITDTRKTVVMHKPPPIAACNAPHVNVSSAQMQAMDIFIYMGSTLSRSTNTEDEVARRIFKVSSVFDRL
ncbi:hypothetical protein SprV_0501901700 [Sparganum proliferum]